MTKAVPLSNPGTPKQGDTIMEELFSKAQWHDKSPCPPFGWMDPPLCPCPEHSGRKHTSVAQLTMHHMHYTHEKASASMKVSTFYYIFPRIGVPFQGSPKTLMQHILQPWHLWKPTLHLLQDQFTQT
jgi:hypothetical protein